MGVSGDLFKLIREQRFEVAGVALESGLLQAPDDPEILHWLGFVRLRQGKNQEALQFMRQALRAQPENTTFLVNYGVALTSCDRPGEAARYLRDALTIDPRLPSAHNNLANALRGLGQVDEAGQHYEAALALRPGLPEAHNNLANIRKEQGEGASAFWHYHKAIELRPEFREAFSNLLAMTRLNEFLSPDEAFAFHRLFGERFEKPLKKYWAPIQKCCGDPGRKLRVGYLSPDCHPAALFFLDPVWTNHDRDKFDICLYLDVAQGTSLSTETGKGVHIRKIAGLADVEVDRRIRADGIDILIDIAGHAGKNRMLVLARKPAPVQITWLDYLGTTGLKAVDYRLTDIWADPDGAEKYHTERLLRMPEGYTQWCYPGPKSRIGQTGTWPPIGQLPALVNGYPTFASFNHQTKLTPGTLDLWSRVLSAVPAARLRCIGVDSVVAQRRLLAHFAVCGQISRVELLPRMSYEHFLAGCNQVDIVLDTLLFSGATTTCDVLWMGVPVLTLPGASSASRSTASILRCLGLDRWVAGSAESYVNIAVEMSRRTGELAMLRQSLRATMQASPLMDAKGFTLALEKGLREAWTEVCTQTRAKKQ